MAVGVVNGVRAETAGSDRLFIGAEAVHGAQGRGYGVYLDDGRRLSSHRPRARRPAPADGAGSQPRGGASGARGASGGGRGATGSEVQVSGTIDGVAAQDPAEERRVTVLLDSGASTQRARRPPLLPSQPP